MVLVVVVVMVVCVCVWGGGVEWRILNRWMVKKNPHLFYNHYHYDSQS